MLCPFYVHKYTYYRHFLAIRLFSECVFNRNHIFFILTITLVNRNAQAYREMLRLLKQIGDSQIRLEAYFLFVLKMFTGREI